VSRTPNKLNLQVIHRLCGLKYRSRDGITAEDGFQMVRLLQTGG
jgi:hypothetical protein